MRQKLKIKHIILIGIVVLLLAIITVIVWPKNIETNTDTSINTVTHKIVEGDNIWEVRSNSKLNQTNLFKNDKKVKSLGLYKSNPDTYMELGDTSSLDNAYDITLDEPKDSISWNADNQKSTNYIKYLLKSGYTIIRQANTPTYIEIYTQNEDLDTKRIVILTDIIMVASTTNTKLPDIDTYYSK